MIDLDGCTQNARIGLEPGLEPIVVAGRVRVGLRAGGKQKEKTAVANDVGAAVEPIVTGTAKQVAFDEQILVILAGPLPPLLEELTILLLVQLMQPRPYLAIGRRR